MKEEGELQETFVIQQIRKFLENAGRRYGQTYWSQTLTDASTGSLDTFYAALHTEFMQFMVKESLDGKPDSLDRISIRPTHDNRIQKAQAGMLYRALVEILTIQDLKPDAIKRTLPINRDLVAFLEPEPTIHRNPGAQALFRQSLRNTLAGSGFKRQWPSADEPEPDSEEDATPSPGGPTKS